MKLSDEAKAGLYTCGIPDYMHGGIIRFYEHGIGPGGFLTAVIDNDLSLAVGSADALNVTLLPNYVRWFYWHAPAGSWGFPGAVEKYVREFHGEDSHVEY
jgi:hypothetical protein